MRRVCEGTKDTHKDIYVWSKEVPACIVQKKAKFYTFLIHPVGNIITDEF